MIFNVKEQPEHLCNIEIDNKRNYFKTQRGKIIENARKMANITYSVIEISCNKLLIGKTFWKSSALPSKRIYVVERPMNDWMTDDILVLKALRRKYESLWRKTLLTVHFDMYSGS